MNTVGVILLVLCCVFLFMFIVVLNANATLRRSVKNQHLLIRDLMDERDMFVPFADNDPDE